MNPVHELVYSQIIHQVEEQVSNQVQSSICDKVDAAIWDIEEIVEMQLKWKILPQARSQYYQTP